MGIYSLMCRIFSYIFQGWERHWLIPNSLNCNQEYTLSFQLGVDWWNMWNIKLSPFTANFLCLLKQSHLQILHLTWWVKKLHFFKCIFKCSFSNLSFMSGLPYPIFAGKPFLGPIPTYWWLLISWTNDSHLVQACSTPAAIGFPYV